MANGGSCGGGGWAVGGGGAIIEDDGDNRCVGVCSPPVPSGWGGLLFTPELLVANGGSCGGAIIEGGGEAGGGDGLGIARRRGVALGVGIGGGLN